MKKLSYFALSLLMLLAVGCTETENPYVGYIIIERAVVEPAANSTATVIADTDIDSEIRLTVDDEGAEWCTATAHGKEITVTATSANTGENFRTATITAKCGYRITTFTVLQKYEGQEYLQYDWTKWTATGTSCQASDGGGYPSLFTEDRTEYWHSAYTVPVEKPWDIIVDMKQELECSMLQIGRRFYPGTGNNYGTVKHMDIYAGDGASSWTKVGEFSFDLPWTAPDGTVVEKEINPLIPAYEEVKFTEPVTTRYFKMVITETNGNNAQVSYFKVFERI